MYLFDAVKLLHLCGQMTPLLESRTWISDGLDGLSTTNKNACNKRGSNILFDSKEFSDSGLVG